MDENRFAASVLAAALAMASSTALAQIVAKPVPGDPVVIESGRISGKVLDSGVKAYFGIPYAAAPVRELRWREPQPKPAWKGVYHADRMGPECIQVLRRKNLNHYFGEEATSEDCLYMNIWAPAAAKAGAKLPVIVYIHGGGYTLGSSGMALYGGENIAKKDALFVNFNFRVGAMGHLAHPDLTAESPRRASGNYGFMDQVAALHWIRGNIAKFGGDPGSVTLTGQSSGAGSIAVLAASPLARGLFHRAVAMSGAAFDNAFPSLSDSEKVGLEVQKAINAKSLADMRNYPADRILALQKDCQLDCAGSITVRPNVDGYLLPDTVDRIFAEGRQYDVPLIVGFTRDESSNELRRAKDLGEYLAAAQKLYGDQAERFLKLYPASTDTEAKAMGLTAAREGLIEMRMRVWALSQSARGKAPVYMYMLSRVQPFAQGVSFYDNVPAIGAYHTSDVPYWFQTQDAFNLFRKTRDWTAYDRDLSSRMMASLLAFARTGNPSTAATPWPRWAPGNERLVDFGDEVGVRTENTERMNFHTPANLTLPTPRLSRD